MSSPIAPIDLTLGNYQTVLPSGSLSGCLILALKDGYSYAKFYCISEHEARYAPIAGILARMRDDRKFDDISSKGVWKYLSISAVIMPQKSSQNMVDGSVYLFKDKLSFSFAWERKKIGFKVMGEYDEADSCSL